MMDRKWGRIIHISSVLGLTGKAGRGIYCTTKSALIGLTHATALDLGPFGVTVNCLAPGPFLTDLPMSILSDEEKAKFAERTALGRWADPRELVGPALMLASDAGSYITGTTVVVDGGLLANGCEIGNRADSKKTLASTSHATLSSSDGCASALRSVPHFVGNGVTMGE